MGAAFLVPLAISALGAGVNAVNQANSRANADEMQSILNQQALQQRAAGSVNALTRQIAQDTPTTAGNQATGQFVQQLRKNGAGQTSTSSPYSALANVPGADARYNTDKAASQTGVQAFGDALAKNMGNIQGNILERQNEGLAQQGEGINLAGINAQSYTQNYVDQLRAQQDAQPNPWVGLFGNLLTIGGQGLSKAGFLQGLGTSSTPATLGDGTVSGGVNSLQMPSVGNWWDNSKPLFSYTSSGPTGN